MIIKSIYIGSFGKLNDYCIDLKNGFNIILGNNEGGKTTIMSFIKMMFYGSTTKSSDIVKNPRKKYASWNGGKMSGWIEFEANGITYKLEREFGASNTTDKISVWNVNAGEKESIPAKIDIGQHFLGLGAAAFEKSVFIDSINISGLDKNDEITQKLMNLSATGDESVSHHLIQSRLLKSKEELMSKRGVKGEYDKGRARLSELSEELDGAKRMEAEKLLAENQLLDLKNKKTDYEQRLVKLKSDIAVQEKLDKASAIAKYLKSLDSIDEAESELKKIDAELDIGGVIADDDFVRIGRETLFAFSSAERLFQEKQKSIESACKQLEELNKNKDESDRLSEIENKIIETNDEIKDTSEEIKCKDDELDTVEKQLSDIEIERQVAVMTEQRKPHLKKKSTVILIACLIALGIIGIMLVLQLLTDIWLVPFSPVPAIIAVWIYVKNNPYKKKTDEQNPFAEMENKKLELENSKEELAFEHDALCGKLETLKSQAVSLDRDKMCLELAKNSMETRRKAKTSDIEKLEEELKKLGAESEKHKSRLADMFGSRSIEEIPEYLAELEKSVKLQGVKRAEVRSMKSAINGEYSGKGAEECSEYARRLMSEIKEICGEKLPERMSVQQFDEAKANAEQISNALNSCREAAAELNSQIRNKYSQTRCVAEIERETEDLLQELNEMEHYCGCIDEAAQVLNQAFSEIRQGFGSALNRKTEEIFSRLTSGKYSELMVSSSFDISVNSDMSNREWQYLSSGTIDQAYLALRLAVSDLLSSEGERLPFMLDDVFYQYDDERTINGMKFLDEYAGENQIILFTCHSHITDIVNECSINAEVTVLKN